MTVVYSELRRMRHSISFEACLPRKAEEPPNGPGWIHEIKHDGFRILARKDGNRVKLITRNGYDFADRYPLIVDGIVSLPVETCIIEGEAIVVDQNGLSIFDLLRYRSTITRQPYSPLVFLNSMVRTCGQAPSKATVWLAMNAVNSSAGTGLLIK